MGRGAAVGLSSGGGRAGGGLALEVPAPEAPAGREVARGAARGRAGGTGVRRAAFLGPPLSAVLAGVGVRSAVRAQGEGLSGTGELRLRLRPLGPGVAAGGSPGRGGARSGATGPLLSSGGSLCLRAGARGVRCTLGLALGPSQRGTGGWGRTTCPRVFRGSFLGCLLGLGLVVVGSWLGLRAWAFRAEGSRGAPTGRSGAPSWGGAGCKFG